MTTREATSFCRICIGSCGVSLTIDENERIVDIRGDKKHPMTAGHACFKGLQAEEAHHGAARLRHPMKRQPDGTFQRISLELALDEIGEHMRRIIERDGPAAVSLFTGNGVATNNTAYAIGYSFMEALESPQIYTPMTIDSSAKIISFERMGGWAAGTHDLKHSEVVMLFGINPLVSHTGIGSISVDPQRRLSRARAEGTKVIVIDPRNTETARHSDLFLQPYPGQDPAIAAGLIRLILAEGWEDAEFCARYVGKERLSHLRSAVEEFTPSVVEGRAGLQPGLLFEAAKMFAHSNRTGAAHSGTGPNMAPFSNLAQHLIDCLNVICGRYRRPGDTALTDMMSPASPILAKVIPAPRSWEAFPPSRIRGIGSLFRERMTGTLPEEILTPGAEQIKCMIVDGGNPAMAVPDQKRMVEALRSLELLVAIDPYMTATAKEAHYIIPPKMQYERADLPAGVGGFALFPDNWIQYAPAILNPPPNSEVIDDWYFFWSIAKRLGLKINYLGKFALDMEKPPTTDDLLSMRISGARITLDELKKYPHGKLFDIPPVSEPSASDECATFDVMPEDVAAELREFSVMPSLQAQERSGKPRFTHLLSTRRIRDQYNSIGSQVPAIRKRVPYYPAYLNPLDLAHLGLESGDRVEIVSDHGRIETIAEADENVRPGVVSITHSGIGVWDDPALDPLDRNCVNLLISCDKNTEHVNAMPWMSAIPINVFPLPAGMAVSRLERNEGNEV